MMTFSTFDRVIVDTNHKLLLLDESRNRHIVNTTVENDLDYVQFEIIMLHHTTTLKSNENNDREHCTTTVEPTINIMTSTSTNINMSKRCHAERE